MVYTYLPLPFISTDNSAGLCSGAVPHNPNPGLWGWDRGSSLSCSLLDLPLFIAAHLFLPEFSRSFGGLFPPTNACHSPASPPLGFIRRPERRMLPTAPTTLLTSTGGKETRFPVELCERGSSRSLSSDCCHEKPQLFIELEQSHLSCQRVMQQWGGGHSAIVKIHLSGLISYK